MSIYEPSTQWANRPADERFPSLEAAYDRARHDRSISKEIPGVRYGTIRAVSDGDEVYLNGQRERARLSFGAMRNLSQQLSSPHGFLATLSSDLVAEILNYKLDGMDPNEQVKLYVMQQPG